MKTLFRNGMITFLLFLLLNNCQTIGTPAMTSLEPQAFYIGTYTDGDSQGIYKYVLHSTGKMDSLGLAVEAENPSYLAFSPDRKFLLAISEVNTIEGSGSVASYLVSGDQLKLMNRRSSGGAHPCFVAVSPEGFVLTANYTGGNVSLLKLDAQGRLSELLDLEQHSGQGTTPRQLAPHAHSAWFKPRSTDIVSIDLGTNELWFSSLEPEQQKLLPAEPQKLALPPGAGPRFLAFHPNGQWLYVVNELNSTVSLVQSTGNDYALGDSYSTLPADFAEANTCAHILLSADGKFLYASNRGHNSIAVFAVNLEDGSLTLLGNKACGGEGPRNFVFSPDERFLLVANQHSANVVSLKRDSHTGRLKYCSQITAPTPVCLLF